MLHGEWWRLITYLFDPPRTNAIFAFFAWYIFYLMGTTLETTWGLFRYNLYLAIGYFASLAFAFLCWFATGVPGQAATNGFLYGSVFLAFARLFPDFELQLFFILPIKIKWLALLTWIGYGWTMVAADTWLTRAMVVAAVLELSALLRPRHRAEHETGTSQHAIPGSRSERRGPAPPIENDPSLPRLRTDKR